MLVDANLLLYASLEDFPQHEAGRDWLDTQLNGPRRVRLPWPALLAFMHITVLYVQRLASPKMAGRPAPHGKRQYIGASLSQPRQAAGLGTGSRNTLPVSGRQGLRAGMRPPDRRVRSVQDVQDGRVTDGLRIANPSKPAREAGWKAGAPSPCRLVVQAGLVVKPQRLVPSLRSPFAAACGLSVCLIAPSDRLAAAAMSALAR